MKLEATIGDFLESACAKYSNQTGFIEQKKYRRRIWTYTDILSTTHTIANLLQKNNLKKGDKIILCAPNSPLWVTIFFACAGLGVIIVPLDFNSKDSFLTKIIESTNPKLIFLGKYSPLSLLDFGLPKIFIEDIKHETKQLPSHCPDWNKKLTPENILQISFSSGSTGEPKGVILTHKNVCSNLYALSTILPLRKEDIFLSIIPLSHMFELTAGLLSPLLWGSTICYLNTIKPNTITKALAEEAITAIVTVPAFMLLLKNAILDKLHTSTLSKYAFTIIKFKTGIRLKTFFVGGAPLDASLESFWNTAGVNVYQGYGMTETSPLISTNTPKAERTGTVGKPLPNVNVKISEEGEVIVSGPNLSSGYWNATQTNTESFTKDGWFYSGDIGSLDSDGFLTIRGRKKNTIITHSGMKVYPEDIERILLSQANIKDAVVIGVPTGTEIQITAIIIPNKKNSDTKSILDKVNSELASHQQMQDLLIWPMQDFPRTATRKIIRSQVLDWVQNRLQDTSNNPPTTETADIVLKTLKQILNDSKIEIQEHSLLVSDLKLDSIKRLALASKLEEDLGIEIDESKITHKTSVEELRKLLSTAQKQQKNSGLPTWQTNKGIEFIRTIIQTCLIHFLSIFQKLEITKHSEIKIPIPSLIIANHQSHLDAITILATLPSDIRKKVAIGAAKDYFFRSPVSEFLGRLILNIFPIDREGNIRESLAIIGKLSDKGYSSIVFPEGTRSLTGEVGEFKAGLGIIAAEIELPIVPIKINGNFEILPKSKYIPSVGEAHVIYGNPVYPDDTESYIELTEKLEKIIRSL